MNSLRYIKNVTGLLLIFSSEECDSVFGEGRSFFEAMWKDGGGAHYRVRADRL